MFRHNISSIILIALILLCPSIQTKKVIYSSSIQNNSSHDDSSAIGAYNDGTILFSIGSKDSLRLIHPNGTLGFINNIIIHCKSKNSCNYYLLNPNYVIIIYLENNDTLVGTVIDWMGNRILKNFKPINRLLSISEKNDRFLIMEYKNEFTEYHVENNGTITNRTSSLGFSNKNKGHIIIEIISLDDAWGFISIAKEKEGEVFFSIIHAESNHKTLNVKRLEDYLYFSSKCITNDRTNDIQYCCLYRTRYNHTLKLVNINNLTLNDNTFNLKSTDLFPDIGFDTVTHIHTIPNVGFLVEAVANLKTKYYIFNFFEIDYFDPNNAFGEWIMNNNNNDLIGNNIFILPNKTIVQIIKNGDSIKFVQEDLSTRIPKSMY
jgi:hypothetical protein